MKVFRVGDYKNLIEVVETTRTSDKSVWFMSNNWHGVSKEIMDRKHTNHSHYYDTFKEAKDYLYKRLTKNIEAVKNKLSNYESQLKELKELKED